MEANGGAPTEIALVYGTAVIHELPLDQSREKATWMWSRYVDENIDEYVDALATAAGAPSRSGPTRVVGWHPV